jgi:hypothetical protein|tara:strand:+ start:704 stop:886 length:183 start_codon:yes stop_codon:yes gene_type:complete
MSITRGFRYEVTVNIKVEPDANFFESDPRYNLNVIQELIQDILYDLDDITVTNCEVKTDD